MKQDEEIASTYFSKFLQAFTSKRQTCYFYSLIDLQERTFNNTNYFSQKICTNKNNKTNVGTSPQTNGCKNNPRKSTYFPSKEQQIYKFMQRLEMTLKMSSALICCIVWTATCFFRRKKDLRTLGATERSLTGVHSPHLLTWLFRLKDSAKDLLHWEQL